VHEGPLRLETDDLTKVFEGGFGLHGVSLKIPAGQIVALGGPNGSGKSTLLRCIAGLLSHGGTVRIDGRTLDGAPSSRTSIGFLPQSVAMPEQATVGEVLDLFSDLRGAGRDTIGLPDGFVRPDDDRIGVLSGGQRHRVALAIALLGAPSLLLLDEPVANLDEEGRDAFWDLLRRLRDERGVTALVSSPAPSELRRVADTGIYMSDGRLVVEERFTDDPFRGGDWNDDEARMEADG
jgi:ABC-type multidrug transport system ATPase subunit